MKNSFRYILTAMTLAFVFGAVKTNAQIDAAYVHTLYQKMDKNLQTLSSLKTTIRMEKYNAQLRDVEDAREGIALVVPVKNSRNANFLLDWIKGAEETLSVVNGKYRLYQPRLKQVIEGKSKDVQKSGDGAQSAFGLINSSAKDLRTNFDAKWLGQEIVANVHSTYKLLLTPKTPRNFDHAEVWVNEEGMVVQFKVYEKNSDWTNILLLNIQKNANVKNEILSWNPPKGTKVVKS